ncbi:PH domain-containing protein [Georgenia satyanarayanai]|uniref:PH domain-containing protein n=1 Tax=Georgenia satyanarayanai TaxID=860221 RepID=A0A2Y9A4M5_9MICO|nr:PH domain-containing protein [Georgenia satyanarayanai]PYG02299.1 PH (Pleckstrin Homology) domain-containing protein [Georgenia satyanarayanai]SSA37157.1 PH domain-containing protein [Georgenia satyanarayanai]
MNLSAELLRPFRPLAARWVASVLLVLTALGPPVLFTVMAANDLDMSFFDVVGILVTAAVLAWLCFRQAAVRAVPDDDGLTVRNLVKVRRLAWEQVVEVRFGPNSPWAQLDLSDGTTLAVMAIQAADGDYARREVGRLAALVQLHESDEPT